VRLSTPSTNLLAVSQNYCNERPAAGIEAAFQRTVPRSIPIWIAVKYYQHTKRGSAGRPALVHADCSPEPRFGLRGERNEPARRTSEIELRRQGRRTVPHHTDQQLAIRHISSPVVPIEIRRWAGMRRMGSARGFCSPNFSDGARREKNQYYGR
jgi:hypothetical protein